MIHELWEDADGLDLFCLAGPKGDGARKLLAAGAKLIWTVDANSHYEAMTAYYKFKGWGKYTTDQEWDMQPYPEEWVKEQQAGLEQEHQE